MRRLTVLALLASCVALAAVGGAPASAAGTTCAATTGPADFEMGEGTPARFTALRQSGTTCGRARTVAGTFTRSPRCDDGRCRARSFRCRATGKRVTCRRASPARRVRFTLK